jgi:hypothetical protein
MEHRHKLSQTKRRKWVTDKASFFQDISFFLSLLINFFITTGYETLDKYDLSFVSFMTNSQRSLFIPSGLLVYIFFWNTANHFCWNFALYLFCD